MAKKKEEKTIRHRGMTMTDEEHEQWHREHKELTPEEHEQLMKHMGISPEEDKKWHEEHGAMTMEDHAELSELLEKKGISKEEQRKWHQQRKNAAEQRGESDTRPLNPFMIGGGFLAYCVKQGWLIQEGKGNKTKYFATNKGRQELAKFDIHI